MLNDVNRIHERLLPKRGKLVDLDDAKDLENQLSRKIIK